MFAFGRPLPRALHAKSFWPACLLFSVLRQSLVIRVTRTAGPCVVSSVSDFGRSSDNLCHFGTPSDHISQFREVVPKLKASLQFPPQQPNYRRHRETWWLPEKLNLPGWSYHGVSPQHSNASRGLNGRSSTESDIRFFRDLGGAPGNSAGIHDQAFPLCFLVYVGRETVRCWLGVLAQGDEGGAGCGHDHGGGLSAGILGAQDTVFDGAEVAHPGGVVAGRGCTRSVADHHGLRR